MAVAEHPEEAVRSEAGAGDPGGPSGTLLPDHLRIDDSARPFAEAVLDELTGLGPFSAHERRRLESEIHGLVHGARTGARPEALAERLLSEPALAASFFQNVDLLYTHAYPGADAVSGLIVRVLEIAMQDEHSASHEDG